MPEKGYFSRMTKFFLLGLAVIALVVAGVITSAIFLLSVPIFPAALLTVFMAVFGVFAAIVVFLVVWSFVYICVLVGTGIYYFFKHPTEWKKEDKGYTVKETKEAGRREEGESKK